MKNSRERLKESCWRRCRTSRSVDQLPSCHHFVWDWSGIRLQHPYSHKATDLQHIRNITPFSLIYLFVPPQALTLGCVCVCVCVCTCKMGAGSTRGLGSEGSCNFDRLLQCVRKRAWVFSLVSTPGLGYFILPWLVGKVQYTCYTQTKESVRDTRVFPGLILPSPWSLQIFTVYTHHPFTEDPTAFNTWYYSSPWL